LEFPAYADLNEPNRPVRTRMPGGVGGVRSLLTGPYPDFAAGLQWRLAEILQVLLIDAHREDGGALR
jgi:hypothetical protein